MHTQQPIVARQTFKSILFGRLEATLLEIDLGQTAMRSRPVWIELDAPQERRHSAFELALATLYIAQKKIELGIGVDELETISDRRLCFIQTP